MDKRFTNGLMQTLQRGPCEELHLLESGKLLNRFNESLYFKSFDLCWHQIEQVYDSILF